MRHTRVVHTKCERDGRCMICDGGLFLCSVCGGFEGSLLPECPGRQLTEEQHEENYRQFLAGTGAFAEASDNL